MNAINALVDGSLLCPSLLTDFKLDSSIQILMYQSLQTGLYGTLDTVAGNGSVLFLGWFENTSCIKSVAVPIRTKHSIQMTCRILIYCLTFFLHEKFTLTYTDEMIGTFFLLIKGNKCLVHC